MATHSKVASIEPKRLGSGNFEDVCQECGTVIVGDTVDDVLGASCKCQSGRVKQYLVELACFMCGREIGTITALRMDTPLQIPSAMCCQVCGGRPVVADAYIVSIYPDVNLPPMRRGRPPRHSKEVHAS